MELWIRSQNKEVLVKCNCLGLEEQEIAEGKYAIINYSGLEFYQFLGAYDYERALKVLDEIQNILQPKYVIDTKSLKPDRDNWVENGVIIQKYTAEAKIEEISTCVYQMPEE